MKKGILIIIVVAVLIVAVFLVTDSNKKPTESITVGVGQITSHPVFTQIQEGIKDGFAEAGYEEGENITFDFQNAQGDPTANQSIAQKFANGSYDMLIPLGTPTTQALVNLEKESPIVFGAVTDPESAGILEDAENPGGNVTGTSDITLYNEHFSLLKQIMPDVQTVGIVYNPGEANAVFALEQAKQHANEQDLTIETAPANTSGEVLAAARSLVDRVDAFYILPDNTVVSAQDAIVGVALGADKPFIALDQSGVEAGALATLSTNYRMVGQRTVELALRVLNGEDPGSIPVLGVTDADLFINTTTAEEIGIEIPNSLLDSAKQIYE